MNPLIREPGRNVSGRDGAEALLPPAGLRYGERLDRNSRWALAEGSRFFEEKSAVQDALRRIAQRLDDLGIPYAVGGGMAVFMHGFRRFTEDLDILVTRESLKLIHQHLDGRGYMPPFSGSKNLRDAELGVKIEFLVTGAFPGDGRPKPVWFPDPAAVLVEDAGIKYLKLATLVELKIASGMTNTERMKDLSDVQELIKARALTADFADELHPYVRDKYRELWTASRPAAKRYLRLWPAKGLSASRLSLADLIAESPEDAEILLAMQADGVTLDLETADVGEYVRLVTSDPGVARQYGMHDETEFWDDQ